MNTARLELEIGELYPSIFRGYENITNLYLNSCILYYIAGNSFEKLINLEFIDLSYNSIYFIDTEWFQKNEHLKIINLSHNLFDSCQSKTFEHLHELQVLNLSYNFLSKIPLRFLRNPSLIKLYLNNNIIEDISEFAFYELEQLQHLEIQENNIVSLYTILFHYCKKLQYLDLSYNKLIKLPDLIFLESYELEFLNLENNQLTYLTQKYLLQNQYLLNFLNMLNNNIYSIRSQFLQSNRNLKHLRITIVVYFHSYVIRNLWELENFELYYIGSKTHILHKGFWSYFYMKQNLTQLKLVFRKAIFKHKYRFLNMRPLRSLHLECTEPQYDIFQIILINFQLGQMPNLQTLTFKNLNRLILVAHQPDTDRNFLTKQLTYLDLTGIQNTIIDEFIFDGFRQLSYINLSHSNIEFISKNTFHKLFLLEQLIMNHSKISVLDYRILKMNHKLKIVNFSSCRLYHIDDFSFINLQQLELLDLRNNRLRNFNKSTFIGIPAQANVYLDNNEDYQYISRTNTL